MIEKFIKYRILFIIVFLIACTFRFESPYHGDYYGEPPYGLYFLITLINLLIFLIPTEKLIFTEKFIYSMIISCFVLIGGGMLVGNILGLIYGYDSNWDELKSPELLDNALFYFVTNFSGIGIFTIWLRYRKPIYQ
ncbi:hypothetical protein [Flavobacterium sp.]|jgi:hypothetical protein|uniref:hypothetical protein n=1 Tax=Flavobacterium sp. TaxID=239 RepID=UPI0037C00670